MVNLKVTFIILLFLSVSGIAKANSDRYTQESVLNKGTWVKFQIEETGIYKITYADLKSMGFSDPSKVALMGYGGWPLDEDFSKPYVDDLPVVSVWKGNDYFLFYGRAKTRWEYNQSIGRHAHNNNPYSDEGFYFLTDITEAKAMENSPALDIAAERITVFDDYMKYEKDEVSINESGRELFGDPFKASSKTFDFNAIQGITDDDGYLECRFISKANTANSTVSLSLNNSLIVKNKYITQPSNSYEKAVAVNLAGKWKTTDANNKYSMQIDCSDSRPTSTFIDYIRLYYKRELKSYNQPFLFFRNVYTIGRDARYVIQNANSNTMVFDITDAINPVKMETKLNESELSFTIKNDNRLHEFVLIQTEQNAFLSIDLSKTVKIKNQNLHGLEQYDMIIISPESLVAEATELAEFHSQEDNLRTYVATPEQIYNEFSSGTPDATAYRRFMKMFYDRRTSEKDAPKYLLLFGDGAYDNRFITETWRKANKKNYLLTYQTAESLNMYSHVVDDYFGFLEDNSGTDLTKDKIDIGIGRFPITTNQQAQDMVKKVISYGKNKDVWKNKVAFVADDGNVPDNYDTVHQIDANRLADNLESKMPGYIVNKIFFDAYKKQAGKYELAENEIKARLENPGLFLINYVGHGDKQSWSDERVITQSQIKSFDYPNLPVWITATCDFCRFDHTGTSAGEDVFLNKKSGGIALFTTSRVAFVGSNYDINKLIIDVMFNEKRDANMRFGDVMKEAKRNYPRENWARLGFCLIGDPALKINFPEDQIEITSINGKSIDADTVLFKAKEEMTIKGTIKTITGQKNTSFNGHINMTILDNWDTYETLGNNTIKVKKNGVMVDSIPKIKYKDYKSIVDDNLIAKVQNGEFTLTFTITEKIAYSNKNNGKISMYALDENDGKEAQGHFLQFKVGGTADQFEEDNDKPEIRMLYLNDSTFTDGDRVNATPYFVAKIWDRTGINISGSTIGHDIILRIDNKPNQTYILNRNYQPSTDVDKEGIVQFSIPELSPGLHNGEFMVWDKMGNSERVEFRFEVIDGLKPNLYKLVATPNPARENVTFKLSHDRPKSRIKVTLSVYDFAGRLQWMKSDEGSSELFKDYLFDWNLINNQGTRMRPGIYVCRATISTNGSKEATEAEKLIILAQ